MNIREANDWLSKMFPTDFLISLGTLKVNENVCFVRRDQTVFKRISKNGFKPKGDTYTSIDDLHVIMCTLWLIRDNWHRMCVWYRTTSFNHCRMDVIAPQMRRPLLTQTFFTQNLKGNSNMITLSIQFYGFSKKKINK